MKVTTFATAKEIKTPIWKVFVLDEQGMTPTISAWTTRAEAIDEAIAIWERAIKTCIKLTTGTARKVSALAPAYQRLRTTNGRWRFLETYMGLRVIQGSLPKSDGSIDFTCTQHPNVCLN